MSDDDLDVYTLTSVIRSICLNLVMGLGFYAAFYLYVLPRLRLREGTSEKLTKYSKIAFKSDNVSMEVERISAATHNLEDSVQLLTETFLQRSTELDDGVEQLPPVVRHYRSLQELLLKLSVLTAVLSNCLLLPANWAGADEGIKGSYTSFNVVDGSQWLWAHALFCWVVTAAAVALIVPFEMKLEARASARLRYSVNKNSLLLYNLAPTSDSARHKFADPFLNDSATIQEYFDQHQPGAVEKIDVVPELTSLQRIYSEYLRVVHALELCSSNADKHQQEEDAGESTSKKCTCCEAQDPTLALVERAKELEEEIAAECAKPIVSTGTAFVTFVSPRALEFAQDHFALFEKSHEEHEHRWKVRRAPPPDQIIWANMKAFNSQGRLMVKLFFNLLFFACIVAVSSPWNLLADGLVNALDKVSDSSIWSDIIESLGAWLPTVILSIFVWVVVPECILKLVKLSNNVNKSSDDCSFLTVYSIYLGLVVYILPPFGDEGYRIFKDVVDGSADDQLSRNKEQWTRLLLFVCSFAFISVPLSLLRAAEFLSLYSMKIFRCIKCQKLSGRGMDVKVLSSSSTDKSLVADAFEFGQSYAETLHIWSIGFIFSGICPPLCLFSLLFLVMKRAVDRWHFLIQPCAERGNPAAMTRICLRFVKAFTLFVNGYVFILLYMKGCYVLAIVTLTLGVIAVGLMFVLHRFWNRFYAEPGPESYATVFDVAEGAAYEHPLMKIKLDGLESLASEEHMQRFAAGVERTSAHVEERPTQPVVDKEPKEVRQSNEAEIRLEDGYHRMDGGA